MPVIRCMDCGKPYPATGVPHVCAECGGIYDFDGPPDIKVSEIDRSQPGYWRYRHAFSLAEDAPVITLGEGSTPLVWDRNLGQEIAFKLESLNPTGSYKDRGSAVLVSQLIGRGVKEAVEDSSGNAGASFAAYAARAGLRSRIFVPESASGPKRNQIEMYGAELVRVPGPRSEAAKAVMGEVEHNAVYASHAYLPFGLAGIATIAYEIWEEMGGTAPGTLIAPVGHGGLLLGIRRGFAALQKAGLIPSEPYYIGVQAAACDPVVRAAKHGLNAMAEAGEGATLAEGVRVRTPVRARALISEITPDKGTFISIEEPEIEQAYIDLGRRGLFVEPTSALAFAAIKQVPKSRPASTVVILTGFGLKYIPSN